VVGGSSGYLDWPVSFEHPCLRPFDIVDGVAELPGYRMLADPQQREVGDNWSLPPTGGPLAWISVAAEQRVVPTYLAGEWGRDWGQLRMLAPYAPNAGRPDVSRGTTEMWGWQDPGPIGDPPAGRPAGAR
jgi:arabinosyltransferase C